MKTINKVLEPIKIPDNVIQGGYEKNRPLIYIPKDGGYIEILGHKLYGEFDSFQSFVDYLKTVSDIEKENKQLKKHMSEFGEYLLTKYEEAKLDAQYYDGVRYSSMQERIYEDLVNRMELN